MKSRFYFVVFILGMSALLLSACQGSDGAFGPIFPTPTQIGIVNQNPVPVDFETLNSDPFIFVDRFVRVTGRYVPLRQSTCSRQRGPSVDWYLISEELEMNMSGFGSLVELAPEQAFFTIDGIWRQYVGPVGCIKEPKEETIWYLEVVRIVDPNPLVASARSANRVTVVPAANGETNSQPEAAIDPQVESQPIETPTATNTLLPTATPLNSSGNPNTSLTTTLSAVTTPITSTPTGVVVTAASSSGTATATPTLDVSAEPTTTATPTVESSGGEDDEDEEDPLGGTGGGTPNPATPVPNPNNYPSPIPPTVESGATSYPSPTP